MLKMKATLNMKVYKFIKSGEVRDDGEGALNKIRWKININLTQKLKSVITLLKSTLTETNT